MAYLTLDPLVENDNPPSVVTSYTLASVVVFTVDALGPKTGLATSLLKSISLENLEDKPWIKLLRWKDGCVLIPKILSKKVLISKNTRYIYV